MFALGIKEDSHRAPLISATFWNETIALLNEEPNYRKVERLIKTKYLSHYNDLLKRRESETKIGYIKCEAPQATHFKQDALDRLFKNIIRRGLGVSMIQRMHDHWWATQGHPQWKLHVISKPYYSLVTHQLLCCY